tara:strand:- start:1664 stop:2764 length:1101 start_codon:yes stop_codon:yes gene_type:complete
MNNCIPTFGSKNIKFRSISEAKWSYIFDILNFDWSYEPFELHGYIPDFIISTKTGLNNILVEVKGGEHSIENLPDYLDKILNSGWKGDIIILPCEPLDNGLLGIFYNKNDKKIKPLNLGEKYMQNGLFGFDISIFENKFNGIKSLVKNQTQWKKKQDFSDQIKSACLYCGVFNQPYIKLTAYSSQNSNNNKRVYLYYNNIIKMGFIKLTNTIMEGSAFINNNTSLLPFETFKEMNEIFYNFIGDIKNYNEFKITIEHPDNAYTVITDKEILLFSNIRCNHNKADDYEIRKEINNQYIKNFQLKNEEYTFSNKLYSEISKKILLYLLMEPIEFNLELINYNGSLLDLASLDELPFPNISEFIKKTAF